MENQALILLGLTLLGSIAGLAGGLIFISNAMWARKMSKFSVPFAAGVLLAVSLTHIIPEVGSVMGERGYFIVLISFLCSYIFEKFLTSMHHHEGNHNHGNSSSTIALVIVGDTIHNFIDGVAIGAAFLIDKNLGFLIALSTFMHEIPHEIGDFGVLINKGWSRLKTILANLFSALSTILGAFIVYWYFPDINEKDLSAILAVAAGIFLYLGATDFLPETDNNNDSKKIAFVKAFFVLSGAGVVYFISTILPH